MAELAHTNTRQVWIMTAMGEDMKSQMTINYKNGEQETYGFVLDENQTPEELQKRMESVFDGSLLRLRVQDESLAERDRLLLIPFINIQSLSLDLPMMEFHLPSVIYVNPLQDE
jgi:hypothetical protein